MRADFNTGSIPFKIKSKDSENMVLRQLRVFISLIWLGMILGISFLETPVKFQAPSVTLEIGLDIGRHVFTVFNKIEIVFALLLALLILIGKQKRRRVIPLGVAWFALALQTIWLLPVLDARVELILQGQIPPPSPMHSIYVGFEVLKALALAVYGFWNLSAAKWQ